MVSLDDINAYSRPQSSLPKGTAHLYSYINRATSPANFEPNLALNLEIADLINSKKGNMPRDAAVAIVHKINSLNPITSLLAIALLDMLVKNCGYAFHLQIATKEFLNELVRRFPERPPPRPSRVQFRVLELLEQWRQTLCTTSKYKDDMGYIRDMHRLLHYKGYDFPEINAGAASVLNPIDSLKSASEMEEEDRAAHSAKLQELIRRGTPADLKEANRLMKVMAGFDQNKVDYRAKAAEETDHIRRKAALLVEMLSGLSPSDVLTDGDIYQELADSIRNAQPKLQKMCEDDSDDQEAVSKLLELNDSINSIVLKYDLLRKGDYAAAQQVPTTLPTMPTSDNGDVSTGPATAQSKFVQDLNLLDFDADEMSATSAGQANANSGGLTTSAPPAAKSAASDMDDLLGLSFGGMESFGASGSISLGQPTNTGGASSAAPSNAFASLNIDTATKNSAPSQSSAQRKVTLLDSPDLSIVLVLIGGNGSAGSPIKAEAVFSNRSEAAVSNIDLQIAVPKSMQLKLESASKNVLQPKEQDGARQSMTLLGGSGSPGWTAKLRFKVLYSLKGVPQERNDQVSFEV